MGYMRIDAIPEARYICDTLDNLKDLPRHTMGTTCWVISEGCEYICNSAGVWNKKIRETLTSSGSVDLSNYYTKEEVNAKLDEVIALTREEIMKIT